jgi:hypothetical protein
MVEFEVIETTDEDAIAANKSYGNTKAKTPVDETVKVMFPEYFRDGVDDDLANMEGACEHLNGFVSGTQTRPLCSPFQQCGAFDSPTLAVEKDLGITSLCRTRRYLGNSI